MTWQYQSDGTDLLVWDHTQTPATDAPYQTETKDDRWPDGTPFENIVLGIMHADAKDAVQSRDIERAVSVVLDGAFRQIERYEFDQ